MSEPMPERERIEKELILDILIESTRWHLDGDDDAIRLEVCDRAKKLFGCVPCGAEKPAAAVAGQDNPKPKTTKQKYRDMYAETHVRVRENGRTTWIYKEDAVKVQDSPTRFHWERKVKNANA